MPQRCSDNTGARATQRNFSPSSLTRNSWSGFLVFSKLYVPDPPHDKLDWLKAGLTSGTSIFLWVYLIKQHNEDVFEYKTREGGE
uniref:NADH dehydrogenase [ubiquinone] 1 subunit C1, mitochondrial n=1 Tax=Sus scrofa TaxID=9823 RepID=A0A8D1SPM1_PIG